MAIWKAIMVEHTLTLDGLPRYEVSDNGDVRIADEWSDYYGRLLRRHIMLGEPVVWLNNGSGKGVGRIHKVRELMESAFGLGHKRGRRSWSASATALAQEAEQKPVNAVFRYKIPNVRRSESAPKPVETAPKSNYRPAEQVVPMATEQVVPKTEVRRVSQESADPMKYEPRLTLEVYGRRPDTTKFRALDTAGRPCDTYNPIGSTVHIDTPRNEQVSEAARCSEDVVVEHIEAPVEIVNAVSVPAVTPIEEIPACTVPVEPSIKEVHAEECSGEAPVSESIELPEESSAEGVPVDSVHMETSVEESSVSDEPKTDEPPKRKTRSKRAGMPNKRAVRQLDMAGNVIAEYESQVAAAAATGITQTSISACCRGKLRKTGGFRWEFVEQSTSPPI